MDKNLLNPQPMSAGTPVAISGTQYLNWSYRGSPALWNESDPLPGEPALDVGLAGEDFPILTLVGMVGRSIDRAYASLKTALKTNGSTSSLRLAGRQAVAYAIAPLSQVLMAPPFPEVDQLRNDVPEKSLLSCVTRSSLLALLLAIAPGVAFGQDALALSSGTAVPGGAVALNLSLSSPAAGAPAAVQWTLNYAAGNIASVAAVVGPSATAAGKTITCFSAAGSHTCLLSGMNDTVIQDGIVAVINVTMTASAVTAAVGLTNLVGAAAAGSAISVAGTGGTITVPLPALTGISCNPTSLNSGSSSVCTAALNQPASAGGATVALSSSTGELSVPASVTIAAGTVSATFTATAVAVPTNGNAALTGALNGSSQTAYLSLVAPTVVSQVSCSPTNLNQGGTSTCTVTLSRAAGSGGATVALSSSDPALTVPASVSVASGAASANFTATALTVTTTHTALVTATYSTSSQTASVVLLAPTVLSLLSCSPASLSSSGTSACTVTLSQPVGSGGVTLTLSSSTAALTVPASVNVASGAASAGFTATAGTLSANQTAVVTASYNGSSQTASISLVAPVLVSLVSCAPTSLSSGGTSVCAVTLSQAAGAAGVTVALSSNNAALTVPASVTVASGAASANFTAAAGTISTSQTAAVTASVNGSSQTQSLTLLSAPPALMSLACAPTTLASGGVSTCVVTLSNSAGSGGAAVVLSSNTSALGVPGVVTVPGGAITASFTSAAGTVSTNQTAVVTASYNGSSQAVSILLLTPSVVSLVSCSPTSLSSGGTSACAVTLSQAAGVGGVTAALSSNNAALAVPSSVTVAPGATSANFTAMAGTIAANLTAVVTATYGGSSQTASIALLPAAPAVSVSLLSCGPASLNSGWISYCTVTLSQAASSGGVTVSLSSSTTALMVPASVSVSAGAASAAFTAVAGTIGASLTAVVTASYNGSSQTASLSLVAPGSIGSLSCVPASLTPGGTSTCTVTLSNAAGSGGAVVTLSSNTAALSVPGSVAVSSGSSTAAFTATAGAVAGSQAAVVTAFYNGSWQTAAIALSPLVSLSSLACTPAVLSTGGTSTCTVTLSSPAGSGGLTVTLSSNAAALTVPASVTFGAGSISASFTASAGPVASAQTAVVTASWNSTSATASFALQTPASQSGVSMACTPDPNNLGELDCTVSLAQAAPAGGMSVALQASTSRIQVPAQVQISAGALSARFVASVISSDQDAQAQITASVQGALTTASVPIVGIRPTSLSCSPQTVPAGGSFTCTVGMNNPNVLQVARLAIASNSTSFKLPSPFTTRPAQAQIGFEVFTSPLAAEQSSTVSVQFGQTTVTSSVAVTPAAAPILSLPGTELAVFGKPVAFAVSAVDPGGLPVGLSAANLPPGASFDPSTGAFLWTPKAPSGPIYSLVNSSPLERRSVTFTATNSARMSSAGSVVIEADPGLPVITDLRNAGSQQSQIVPPKPGVPTQPALMSCSPGSVATLLGRWLAAGTQPTSNPTGSSTQLAGAEVMVNGNPAPVVYASPMRVDFVCPEAASGGQLEISAHFGGAASNVVRASQQATLGLFSADGSGQGQGMAMLSGTSLLATPRSYLNAGQPAEPGDTISILATGAGLETSLALVQISIGATSTTPIHVQPMPGMAGVYQVDVTVPAGVAPGDAVPIAMQVGDSSGKPIVSNTVTIAVEAAR